MKSSFAILLFLLHIIISSVCAAEFEASFKNAEIGEFINTVSKNLNKTIILDPSVKGHISIRSHEMLDDQQYYQFFLSVLDVYGFAVLDMNNGVLKVVPSKNARSGVIPLSKDGEVHAGDELITRVLPLKYVTAKELAPLLRQLNDAAAGSVVHYDPSNMLIMTGRSAVIDELIAIVKSVDISDDHSLDKLQLENASATQIAALLNSLQSGGRSGNNPSAKAVSDSRTNALLISGERSARKAMISTALELDKKEIRRGNARVIYLKHAKAENLLDVLTGINSGTESQAGKDAAVPAISVMKDVVVKADKHTNSLVINAPPEVLVELEQVIQQLDIERAQVLVEAIIVEVQDADGLALGVQWSHSRNGGIHFPDSGASLPGWLPGGIGENIASTSGLTAGFYHGNWQGLFTALQSNTESNILATPSIVTLDNMEAEFTVGQDVPVLTGSQTTTGDNVYQTVSRRSIGIKLKVKPQISQGSAVVMEIEQEVSSLSEAANKDNLGPTFNTRTVRNAVQVVSGNTVVVGGLLDNNGSRNTDSVPFLGKLPLVGALFRYQSDKTSKRNLMLFIRPTIIRSQNDYADSTALQRNKFGDALVPSAAAKSIERDYNQILGANPSYPVLEETRRLITDFYQANAK